MKQLILILAMLCSTVAQADLKLRPSEWAVPVIGSDLENMYALSSKVYRSEQPKRESFILLEKFGIKEVLNLRQYHSDRGKAENTNLTLHRIRMNAGDVKTEQILQALKIIKASKGPILIHCWHGSDRTGIVSAAYRIVFQNWSKEKAIEEMKDGGYGYHESFYPNLIETIKALDVRTLKIRLGLLPASSANDSSAGSVRLPREFAAGHTPSADMSSPIKCPMASLLFIRTGMHLSSAVTHM